MVFVRDSADRAIGMDPATIPCFQPKAGEERIGSCIDFRQSDGRGVKGFDGVGRRHKLATRVGDGSADGPPTARQHQVAEPDFDFIQKERASPLRNSLSDVTGANRYGLVSWVVVQ